MMRLWPQPSEATALAGLYLAQDLRAEAIGRKRPFVYANFVTSLDGRIAIPDKKQGGLKVPGSVANDRDWRLFQELAVQADVIITTGRYLRDYAAGKAQEILRVQDDPAFADLAEWRRTQGLSPQPDLAVVSHSLDFPVPYALRRQERRVVVVTDRRADPARVARIESQLSEVVVAGEQSVQGSQFVDALAERGYGTIYSAAGPRILHMLLADGVLDRLYLTTVPRLLGGDPFASIVDGPLLEPATDMTLRTLYHDTAGVDGLGQLFACYERAG
jgi:riboflavin biosynthesis pyrimidine reductase